MNKQWIALFWKEYRQQRILVAALLLFSLLIQLSMCMMTMLTRNAWTSYFSAAVFITSLYAAGAGAVLFVSEHEERTYPFLRGLPVSGTVLLSGKLAWLLASTLVLGLCTAACSLIWIPFTGSGDEPSAVFGVYGTGVMEALCWSVFWSPRCRRQLHSLLMTFASASLGAYLVTVFHHNLLTDGGSTGIAAAYASAMPFRLGLALPVGLWGLFHARSWIRERTTVPSCHPVQTEIRWDTRKAILPKRGEYRWLFWHTVKQSWRMLLFGTCSGLAVFGWLMSHFRDFIGKSNYLFTDFTGMLILGFGIFAMVVYCGDVFGADRKSDATNMLLHKGISPAKIWWSRILVFAVPYGVTGILLAWFGSLLIQTGHTPEIFGRYKVLSLLLLYFGPFSFGLLLSQLLRSPVVAVVMTGMTLIPFGLWTILTWHFFQFSPVWTVLPVLIGCFLASRLHAADWLKERPLRQCRKRLLIPLLVPSLMVLAAVPLVRVYSVPAISLGYSRGFLYDDDFGPPDFMSLSKNTKRSYQVVWNWSSSSKKETNPLESLKQSWKEEQFSMRRPAVMCLVPVFVEPHWNKTMYNHVTGYAMTEGTGAACRQAIAFLESIPKERATLPDKVRWIYYYQHYLTRNDLMEGSTGMEIPVRTPLWYRVLTPWEKTRTLRRLERNFQVASQMAGQMENCIYHDVGSYESLLSQYRDHRYGFYDPYKTTEPLEHVYYQEDKLARMLNPVFEMESEIVRRISLLKIALYGWYQEHGELPETLDALKGTYLAEIPLVPCYNVPFGYYPHPDGSEIKELGIRFNSYDGTEMKKLEQDPTIPFLYTVINVRLPWTWTSDRYVETEQRDQEEKTVIGTRYTETPSPGDCYPLLFTKSSREAPAPTRGRWIPDGTTVPKQ
ncbi:MAG: hypothetical protein LBQ54_13840 [Planctomycetaceae bacterium]|jgi:ABC-type transport system involved in multi-copper enzyme maturation permease subunit|nr:hypothetical protein [Planctomycetaceae bacterium]